MGCVPHWQKISNILLSNSIEASVPAHTTNLQKWATAVANTLDSGVNPTNVNDRFSHLAHSKVVVAVGASNSVKTSPSNNSVLTNIRNTSEQEVKLPRRVTSPKTLAESEEYIPNSQKSSNESIVLPVSILESIPARTKDLQKWNAFIANTLGNGAKLTNASGKLSHFERSELTGTVGSSNSVETSPSNNSDRTHIRATSGQAMKFSGLIATLQTSAKEENASPLVQLVQKSPRNLPQQTPADITELEPKSNPLLRPSVPEEVQINKTVPITLQQALQLVRRNNQQLQVAELEVRRSRLALREIQSSLYPTVGIEASLSRDLSAQGQLSVESQQRQIQDQKRQSQQLTSQLQADLDAVRNSPAPDPAIDPAGFIQRELAISQRQSQLEQAQIPSGQTQGSQPGQENFATTTLNGSLNLNYDLFTSGRRSANIRAAEEEVRLSELELERVAEQLRLDITDAYYNLQDAGQQVRIEEDAVRRATILLRDATLLREAQLATRLDEVNTRVELENAQQRLVRAQSQQETARRELARLLSIPSVINVLAADPVQQVGAWTLSLPESIVLALQNRAELEQQLVQRNISEQRRRIALAALGPTVSVFASYNMLRLSTGDPSEFASRGFADGYSLGARARWDLFDGGAAKARAGQEEVNRAIAETRFADVSKQVRLEVERAFYNLTSNQRNIQTATLSLEGAREALRLARLRFQAGVGPLSDVITAESNVTEAEGNRVRAILNYNRALAALQRAISNFPGNRLNRVI